MEDEHTFLCGYQRTRGYGSLSKLNYSKTPYASVIRHRIEPSDTLQGLVLKYNSSMTELKRLNRLWSNESIHFKEYISIPVYDRGIQSQSQSKTEEKETPVEKPSTVNPENYRELFTRIDANIKVMSHQLKKNFSVDETYKKADPSECSHTQTKRQRISRSTHSNQTNKI